MRLIHAAGLANPGVGDIYIHDMKSGMLYTRYEIWNVGSARK